LLQNIVRQLCADVKVLKSEISKRGGFMFH
jgi:hypothetical protein